jgi:O-antigen/teichoic acid export membrane protein
MSTANLVGLFVTVAAYLAYSRLLSPADFGMYAAALAIAKFGAALLDGGIKVGLIQRGNEPSQAVRRTAFLASIALAIAGIALLAAGLLGATFSQAMSKPVAWFIFAYAAAYFVTYPFIVIPLASLEREMRFGPIARIEGVTICIEYGLPALLWAFVLPGFWSFIVAAWIARGLRAGMLLAQDRNRRRWLQCGAVAFDWREIPPLVQFGSYFQLAAAASMARDNMHLFIVGPLFGREWAGLYAWALQMCGTTSQIFVQTASRVSLPMLIATDGAVARWRVANVQIVWLAILTIPPLVCLVFVAPLVNELLFKNQWSAAILLLPFLIARMIPSLATTTLGTLLLTQRGAKSYAFANIQWALAELVMALAFLALVGHLGLAYSYSVMAWFGLFLLVRGLGGQADWKTVIWSILARPSMWIAIGATAALVFLESEATHNIYLALACAAVICLVSMASERVVRTLVADTLRLR